MSKICKNPLNNEKPSRKSEVGFSIEAPPKLGPLTKVRLYRTDAKRAREQERENDLLTFEERKTVKQFHSSLSQPQREREREREREKTFLSIVNTCFRILRSNPLLSHIWSRFEFWNPLFNSFYITKQLAMDALRKQAFKFREQVAKQQQVCFVFSQSDYSLFSVALIVCLVAEKMWMRWIDWRLKLISRWKRTET